MNFKLERRHVGFGIPPLAVVLAGGRGKRLGSLTAQRCKPELPFAKNRLVDFALANVINSGINHTMVLTQYMYQKLSTHIDSFNYNSQVWGKWVTIVPAMQQSDDESWYKGTANAVYQNREMIRNDPAKTVVILAADHIYKLDIRQMQAEHEASGSQFTVCGIIMQRERAAGNFGVMELDHESRIVGFEEKPLEPKHLPGQPDKCFASMGIYFVSKDFLLQCLDEDHIDENSTHDFGNDVIPKIIAARGEIYGYNYNDNIIPGEIRLNDGGEYEQVHYWRDVGRVGPYWEAVMDLTEVKPYLNLYNPYWPVPTAWDMQPPAKIVTPSSRSNGVFENSILSGGCIIDEHGIIKHVVFSRLVVTGKGANLEKVIVLDGAQIGAGCNIRNTIIEEGVIVPPGVRIGFDINEDRANSIDIDEYHDSNAWYDPIRIVTKCSFLK